MLTTAINFSYKNTPQNLPHHKKTNVDVCSSTNNNAHACLLLNNRCGKNWMVKSIWRGIGPYMSKASCQDIIEGGEGVLQIRFSLCIDVP